MKKPPSFQFSDILLRWNKSKNTRQMPWKGEKDPYRIWLSEIILQQTRVEQGLKYYQDFLKQFPNIHTLAQAPDQKIYKAWEGLGYYTRCRNLIKTARHISEHLKGKFPSSYDEIKELDGVGPYTAAAIASFAFNEPKAVVDGNVFRLLSRLFAIEKPIDSAEGKKMFTQLANELLNKKMPGIYNQAIMDFGAVICKPAPVCEKCPFTEHCRAFIDKMVNSFPVKGKKPKITRRWFNYFVLEYRGRWAIRQRSGDDIWHSLFEFPLIESASAMNRDSIVNEARKNRWIMDDNFKVDSLSPVFRQQLSHQLVEGRFAKIELKQKPQLERAIWVKENEIKNYAFPKFIHLYLFKSASELK